DDRADHYLHAVTGRDFAQSFDSDADPRLLHAPPLQFVTEPLRALLVAGRDHARAILFNLSGEQLDVRPRAQSRYAEPPFQGLDDAQGVAADRAGRTENRNLFHMVISGISSKNSRVEGR